MLIPTDVAPRLALLLLTAVPCAAAPAQGPLSDALESWLSIVADDEAAAALDALLARDDATPEALHAALTSPRPTLTEPRRIDVPHGGDNLAVDIRVPEDRAGAAALPVLFVINWSSPPLDDAVRDHVIQAEVPGFKPEQFSDRGRDAHLKILRTVCYEAGGDPDNLWFTGYSWGGHACWDDALHRPGVVRGFVGRGGGPLRQVFRLFPNLAGVRVLAVCGAKDDPELVWNLQEVSRRAKRAGFEYSYWEAPDNGHDQPLPGEFEAGQALVRIAGYGGVPTKGTLVADAPFVEHPLLRILDVQARAVALPKSVRVSPRATPDEQRRAVIDAMDGVASIDWSITTRGQKQTLTLQADGVKAEQVFLREPWFSPGDAVVVKARRKVAFDDVLEIDPRALLEEARRTGDRQRPVLRRVDVDL